MRIPDDLSYGRAAARIARMMVAIAALGTVVAFVLPWLEIGRGIPGRIGHFGPEFPLDQGSGGRHGGRAPPRNHDISLPLSDSGRRGLCYN